MRLRYAAFAAVALLSLSAGLVRAETVNESWRSPFGSALAVAVDEMDGSCWAVTGGSVMHFDANGNILSQTNGFRSPNSLAVDTGDGTCWVADTYSGRVVHLDIDGAISLEDTSFACPLSVSVDPTDGSCWVADQGFPNASGTGYDSAAVVRLSADGGVIWEGADSLGPSAVSVDVLDRSVWVVEQGVQQAGTGNFLGSAVTHLTMDGVPLWSGGTFNGPFSVSADPGDGATRGHSVWVADTLNGEVVHLSPSGSELSRTTGYGGPVSVSVDTGDGSCWVADLGGGLVSHLDEAGDEVWYGAEAEGFWSPTGVAADAGDGSCWVADMDYCSVTHLDAAGQTLWWGSTFIYPSSVSSDWVDGTSWVADADNVVHLDTEGTELARVAGFDNTVSVSVDLGDGTCWVADLYASEVVHLDVDGTVLARVTVVDPEAVAVDPVDGSCWIAGIGTVLHLNAAAELLMEWTDLQSPMSVAVDAYDGSCWVADEEARQVVHLSPDGSVLWRGGNLDAPTGVSVDPYDGSCWVADWGEVNPAVVHLAADGTELARKTDVVGPVSVAVNPMDGSCWVADALFDEVLHLDSSAAELWRGDQFFVPAGVAVDPYDGACWVADEWNGQVALLTLPAYPSGSVFWDVPFGFWARPQIVSCYDSGIVQGYANGSYRPGDSVTRAQMAVYIARALANGDGNVLMPSGPATFEDANDQYWAYKYIEYCVAHGVVEGYDPTHYWPEVTVTRDQMAVFIARAKGWVGIGDNMTTAPEVFPDVPAGYWCGTAVKACVDHGVVQGYDDGKYHPEYEVTRDQMAVYIQRAFGLPM